MPGITEEYFDVVVVGAGWNGLIAAKTYLELAPETNLLIVDNGKSIGGVWSKEKIYPNLYAQISHGLFEYSFYPMKKEGISPDGYIPGTTIHNYLVDFARDFDLTRRIRLETNVIGVDKLAQNGWRLNVEHASSVVCAKLIYATGPTSNAIIPAWPRTNFQKPVIHSSQIGTHLDEIGEAQRATVIGAAKSSYDTVFLLLRAGKKIDWIIREDGSGPLAITAPRLLGLWNMVDVVSTRAVASFSPSIMNTSGWWYQFLHQTKGGRLATKLFWRNVTRISEWHAGYSKNSNVQKLRPIPHGYGIFWANSGLGVASVPDFWKTFHAGDVTVHRTDVESLSHLDVVNLKNGYSIATDFVITCTGFEKPYQTFSDDAKHRFGLAYDDLTSPKWAKLDALGEENVDRLLPLLKKPPMAPATRSSGNGNGSSSSRKHNHGPSRHYRRLVVPSMAAEGDRSVYFPGLIHSIFTPLVSEFQALWGVAFMLGRLDLPDQDTMEEEVATFNAWTRKRYLEQGRKHAYSIYDYLSYIDTLARDLGVKVNRKSNPFSEMFLPYRPSDYRGLVGEFLQAEAARNRAKVEKAS